jgi:hypothetical protein
VFLVNIIWKTNNMSKTNPAAANLAPPGVLAPSTTEVFSSTPGEMIATPDSNAAEDIAQLTGNTPMQAFCQPPIKASSRRSMKPTSKPKHSPDLLAGDRAPTPDSKAPPAPIVPDLLSAPLPALILLPAGTTAVLSDEEAVHEEAVNGLEIYSASMAYHIANSPSPIFEIGYTVKKMFADPVTKILRSYKGTVTEVQQYVELVTKNGGDITAEGGVSYKVMYDDGDKEDLEEEDLAKLEPFN